MGLQCLRLLQLRLQSFVLSLQGRTWQCKDLQDWRTVEQAWVTGSRQKGRATGWERARAKQQAWGTGYQSRTAHQVTWASRAKCFEWTKVTKPSSDGAEIVQADSCRQGGPRSYGALGGSSQEADNRQVTSHVDWRAIALGWKGDRYPRGELPHGGRLCKDLATVGLARKPVQDGIHLEPSNWILDTVLRVGQAPNGLIGANARGGWAPGSLLALLEWPLGWTKAAGGDQGGYNEGRLFHVVETWMLAAMLMERWDLIGVCKTDPQKHIPNVFLDHGCGKGGGLDNITN
eukprot:6491334-Amphidinium_carterae.1